MTHVAAILAVVLVLIAGCAPKGSEPAASPVQPGLDFSGQSPAFDGAFWSVWGDGQAELAGYELTFPRYGQPRQGVAVTIFVSEPFSNALRVKSDPGRHGAEDEFPVMKLNLIQDFPTGIYDYNEMTSSFVALEPVNGRPAGSLTKVSFSSQEWCGHLWHQLLFDPSAIRSTLHSYFDGEADQTQTLGYPAEALPADALHHWARGMAYPVLRAGESRQVALLPSLQSSRHSHQSLAWTTARISRAAARERITVPAGEFETERLDVESAEGTIRSFYVETAAPRRIIRWQSSTGEQASLLSSRRLKYWQRNASGLEKELESLGLRVRPPRTP